MNLGKPIWGVRARRGREILRADSPGRGRRGGSGRDASKYGGAAHTARRVRVCASYRRDVERSERRTACAIAWILPAATSNPLSCAGDRTGIAEFTSRTSKKLISFELTPQLAAGTSLSRWGRGGRRGGTLSKTGNCDGQRGRKIVPRGLQCG